MLAVRPYDLRRTFPHTHTHTRAHTHAHSLSHTHTLTHSLSHTHAHAHTHTHTLTHSRTRTHTHAHARTPAGLCEHSWEYESTPRALATDSLHVYAGFGDASIVKYDVGSWEATSFASGHAFTVYVLLFAKGAPLVGERHATPMVSGAGDGELRVFDAAACTLVRRQLFSPFVNTTHTYEYIHARTHAYAHNTHAH
ncbi:hypothetical protein T492DRAFT_497879 [Pavlovales sp. CCMP2436]|nr:hypothetical protein T492DRAFT_497879 [Pavlovales sp. CCMP2436]